MPSRPGRRRTNKKKKKKLHESVSVVGPECVHVLRGELSCSNDVIKEVSLVLCGESHFDAIDVTRSGGRFFPKYGWNETTELDEYPEYDQEPSVRILQESRKLQPLSLARTWATEWVESQDEDEEMEWHTPECQLLLLWFPLDTNVNKSNKGKAYIVELRRDKEEESDYDDDSSAVNRGDKKDSQLPPQIVDWTTDILPLCAQNGTRENHASTTDSRSTRTYKMFEWGDLDEQARELNRRRLSEERISTAELDSIVQTRKAKRKQEDIWTFDDWFSHLQTTTQEDNDNTGIHMILEATIPPWEVELERSAGTDHSDNPASVPPAHDIIRCVSEDSEPSTVDMFDPFNDGMGSYMDFCYRKFMNQMLSEQQSATEENGIHANTNHPDAPALVKSTWLHCVDTRDLGCEAACHADDVKEKWKELLLPDERIALLDPEDGETTNTKGNTITNNNMFQPASKCNPELTELESLRSRGMIQTDDGDSSEAESQCDRRGDGLDFAFPSFECFFGQCTDFLYYSPHIKVSYSPFLAKCVNDVNTWEDFFDKLFLGGTIPDALAMLDLSNREFGHVRSPILQQWDFSRGQYVWKEREETEEYISSPYFPHVFYLKARNSTPPRTWCSQLYSDLTNADDDNDNDSKTDKNKIMTVKNVAEAARAWTKACSKRHSEDPKASDDEHCGGEWFEAYLRACHPDIYEDVDTSDAVALSQKSYVPSESQGRRKKYNVGKIKIPNTQQIFDEIQASFENKLQHDNNNNNATLVPGEEKVITPRVETLSKILVDIWVCNLVDFSTVLKIADIVNRAKEERVVVVCYMGNVHIRAVADFFCKETGFRKTSLVGKYTWEEEEVKTLKFPSSLWNVSELFR